MTRNEAIAFRKKIEQAAALADDETALEMIELFPLWVVDKAYAVDDRVQHESLLYKCIQAHTSQGSWAPNATPALWVRVSVDEWPEWVQPTGAHDAYNTGDKVTYNGKHYICTSDANVYAPGVFGWDEVS